MHKIVTKRIIDARFGRYSDMASFDPINKFGDSVAVPKSSSLFETIRVAFQDPIFLKMHYWYTGEQLFEQTSDFISKKLFPFNHLCYIISISSIDNEYVVDGGVNYDNAVLYESTARQTFTSVYKMFIIDKNLDN